MRIHFGKELRLPAKRFPCDGSCLYPRADGAVFHLNCFSFALAAMALRIFLLISFRVEPF